jgi:hypothetical protein
MILSLRRVKPLAQFISSSQVRYRNAARRPHGTTRIRNEEVFHAGAVQISPLNLTPPSIRPVYPAPGHVESDFTRMNQSRADEILHASAIVVRADSYYTEAPVQSSALGLSPPSD